jgi:hypothetical protein
MKRNEFLQQGSVSGALIASVVLGVLVVVLGSVAIWAIVNYNDQKDNVDSKIEVAVSAAKQQQAADDDKKFAEREKEPYDKFIGPDELGRVEFDFPKTWSAHVARDGEKGTSGYEAYLYPKVVPPIENDGQYALRVIIEARTYEEVLRSYENRVENGDLRSSSVTISGYNGTRLDGKFSKEIEGSAVFFKVRDKTLMIATDATVFRPDFNNIILKSLNFNP